MKSLRPEPSSLNTTEFPVDTNKLFPWSWKSLLQIVQLLFLLFVRRRVQGPVIQTSVHRAALKALTQDLCFYLFYFILSISGRPTSDTPAACDVDTAKPAFDFLLKWVKRQHTCRGRRAEVGGLGLEAGRGRKRQEENWGVTNLLSLKLDPLTPLLPLNHYGALFVKCRTF